MSMIEMHNINSDTWSVVITFTISYLIGSIPFGFLIGKLKGINVRKHGSGNIGATNVWRTVGKKYGIATAILDGIKGVICIAVSQRYSTNLGSVAMLGSVVGHSFPVFLRFNGGKGVATFFFGILFLDHQSGIMFLSLWLTIAICTGYASLASILSVCACSIVLIAKFYIKIPYIQSSRAENPVILIIITAIIMIKHKENIKRLLDNNEPRAFNK